SVGIAVVVVLSAFLHERALDHQPDRAGIEDRVGGGDRAQADRGDRLRIHIAERRDAGDRLVLLVVVDQRGGAEPQPVLLVVAAGPGAAEHQVDRGVAGRRVVVVGQRRRAVAEPEYRLDRYASGGEPHVDPDIATDPHLVDD